MWEVGGVSDAFGLEKMTAFVAGDDFESRADGETNSRDKGIPKADSVHVLAARMNDQLTA